MAMDDALFDKAGDDDNDVCDRGAGHAGASVVSEHDDDDDDDDLEDLSEVIDATSFDELRLSSEACEQVRLCWAAFLGNFATPEEAGDALFTAIFESAPTLQSLFTTPKAVQSMRFVHELDSVVATLNKPKALKNIAESLAFRHLNLDVTVPRAMIFRDAILDLIEAELGDRFTTEARRGFTILLGWMAGANIYVKASFGDRLRLLQESWRKVNKTQTVAEKDADREAVQDIEGGEDADGLPKRDAGRRAPSSTSKLGNRIKNRKTTPLLASSKEPVKSSQGTFVLLKGGMGSDDMVVPTNYREMFEFNSAVMGFSGSSWLPEVLDSFDSIVVHAADSNRLQQECDLLAVRISKKVSGTVNLSQYKSCMLASLRSLLPKEWDSNYEVAWNWLWDNVERLIVKNVEKPPVWEAAVRNMMDSFGPEEMYRIRALIFERFFVAAASGQEYFKQSDTRLHFIMEKVLQMTVDMFQDPWQLTDDISALGLRHVGYGIPTQLFGPFVSCCVEVIGEATDSKNGLEGFRWSLALISRLLVRTITEGSTIVMKAVNSNSARQLQTAISCAPRGSRAQWLLNIEVGTHAISPLFWSIESGSLDAARAIIEDLLVIRADRERYYYGAPDLFLRHQDIMQRLCLEAPALLPTLLDGLVWRSTRTSNGLRRANYYIEHLMSNAQGEPADALRELCTTKDPKIMTHPVLVTLSDSLWSGVVQKQFLFERIWFICSLVIFLLVESFLPKIPELRDVWIIRLVIFAGRVLIYLNTMCRLLAFHAKGFFKAFRKGAWKRKLCCLPFPLYLKEPVAACNFMMMVLLICMCSQEPMFHCIGQPGAEFPTMDCPEVKDIRRRYSMFGMLAIALHWALMIDLSVFSTGLSAFVLVCAQVLSEIGRFLVALIFLLLTFGSAIAVLEHGYFEMRDIPHAATALFAITVVLYEDDYRSLLFEPALLTAVLLYVLASSILLMNLLIAQLNNSYTFIYNDMVGFARLNRATNIVETLKTFPMYKWKVFVESLKFDQPLEFNQGDVGFGGGIQVEEPSHMYSVLTDSVNRFGGSCSPDMQWPDESNGSKLIDRYTKVQKLARKVLRQVTKDSKAMIAQAGTSTSSSGQQGRSGVGSSSQGGSKDDLGISGFSRGISGASSIGSL